MKHVVKIYQLVGQIFCLQIFGEIKKFKSTKKKVFGISGNSYNGNDLIIICAFDKISQ